MSLIEVVVFIVVLGIGIAGTVVLFGKLTESSVDPVVRKQTLAIAASLLEEIELRPFTICDPDDANVFGPGACATPEAIGPEAGPNETRYGDPRFDNVNDYHGFSMVLGDIRNAQNDLLDGLADYEVLPVTVANAGADFGLAADHVLLITVTARHQPTQISVTLQSYRFRYAPNSP